MVKFMVIGVIAALCAVGAARELNAIGADSPHAASVAAVAAATPASQLGSGETSIVRAPDGQFWADATVDGHQMHFLVDTGASEVTLTADDARNLGIDPDMLNYTQPVETANGLSHGAEVTLGLVSVGRAEVSDVKAMVIDKGLATSLLGMSYLNRLSTFEASKDTMVLKS